MFLRLIFLCLIFIPFMFTQGVQATEIPQIDWKITNPFRLFKSQQDFKKIVWPSNQLARDFVAFKGEALEQGFIPLNETNYVRQSGQYATSYVDIPKEAQVEFSLKNNPYPYDNELCQWEIGLKSFAQQCSKPRIEYLPYNKKIHVKVIINNTLMLEKDIELRDFLIVALGDSYASGEGNPDIPAKYFPGKPTYGDEYFKNPPPKYIGAVAEWWDSQCHRSLYSWQALAALRLAIANPKRSITFVSFACSGATLKDILLQGQKEPVGYMNGENRPVEYSQVESVKKAICSYKGCRTIDALLLSIGGNDVDFAGVVKGIILPDEAQNSFPGSWIRTASLWLTRTIKIDTVLGKLGIGTVSSSEAIEMVNKLKAPSDVNIGHLSYADQIKNIAYKLSVPLKNTILMRYPDPIPTVNNCDKSNKLITCEHELNPFQNLNDGLFHYLKKKAPLGIGGEWVTEVKEEELYGNKEGPNGARQLIDAINSMQDTVKDTVRVVEWNMPGHDMCQFIDNKFIESHSSTESYKEAYYFCDSVKNTKCPNPPKEISECKNTDFSNWHPYKQPRSNRGVYLANESILMLRRWDRHNYNYDYGKDHEEITGMMHPTLEAHAIAADSAFQELENVIRDKAL